MRQFCDRLAALADKVLHHAHEEETDLFPKAQDAPGKPTVEAMEPKFLLAKRQIAEAY